MDGSIDALGKETYSIECAGLGNSETRNDASVGCLKTKIESIIV
jgi:hypothetical protein